MGGLHNKTILVTGACGNVGLACVDDFLSKGAKVVMTDRTPPPEHLSDRDDVLFRAADVVDIRGIGETLDAGVRRFGRIDGAVLAAGIEGVAAAVEDIAAADIDEVFNVNVKGSLFWMQACLRHMKENRTGSIVALSSISGVVGSASMAAYTMSKHAVIGLVKAAALESGRYGVRINAVCPGPIESDMMRRLDAALARLESNPAAPRNAAMGIPMQRYVTAAEVAHMAAFLCSDEAASCHGGTFMVDGGFTAK